MESRLGPESADAVTLRPRKRRFLGLFGLSVVFLIGVFLLERDTLLILSAGFLGLCALILLITLLPNSSYLKLTPKGFIVRSLYRTGAPTPWSAVTEFQVGSIPPALGQLVLFNFSPDYPKAKAGRTLAKAIAGYEGALPDTYGLAAGELANLLRAWRRHHSGARSSEDSSPAVAPTEVLSDGEYVLSGYDSEANYVARMSSWEPGQSFTTVMPAEDAARVWLASQGSEAQVEIIRISGGEGQVVAVVTQTGMELIA